MASRTLRLRRNDLRGTSVLILTLLFIEFLDELVYGAREAAWPLVRDELHLDYAQIGLLLSVPPIAATLLEMVFGVMADTGYRRKLVLGGGVAFALSVLLTALSQNFGVLLISFCIFYPASGAFVSLSQATLMDVDPKRHEQNMARWTFAGAVGVFVGPLLLGATGGDWRGVYAGFAVLTIVALLIVSRAAIKENGVSEHTSLLSGMRAALSDLRRFEVLRWLMLLQFADLLGDVLFGYLALYMVDVAGADIATTGLAVVVLTGVGLVGDLLIIPVLERVRGLTYLRYSALVEVFLYAAFLLVPGILPKIVLLGLVGIFNSGWYSVLQAQVYTVMPGRSGSVMTVGNVFGLVGGALPFAVGAAAQAFGLDVAMWLLLLGPLAVLVGIPRTNIESQMTLPTAEQLDGHEE
jgi:FSR family fosmidomycin resistance protein-like MFS transporter